MTRLSVHERWSWFCHLQQPAIDCGGSTPADTGRHRVAGSRMKLQRDAFGHIVSGPVSFDRIRHIFDTGNVLGN